MIRKLILSCAVVLAVSSGATVRAGDVLGGIEGLACQAKLCLSTGSPPAECSPALNYYYGLKGKTSAKTRALREQFLNRCPMVSQADSSDNVMVNYYVADCGDVRVSAAFVAGPGLYIQDANGYFQKASINDSGKVFVKGTEYIIEGALFVEQSRM